MQYDTESARRNGIMELLYAGYIALSGETVEEVLSKLHTWKTVMEPKGLKVNVGKTKALSLSLKLTTIAAIDSYSVVASELVLTLSCAPYAKSGCICAALGCPGCKLISSLFFNAQHAQAVTILSLAMKKTLGNSSRSARSPSLAIA